MQRGWIKKKHLYYYFIDTFFIQTVAIACVGSWGDHRHGDCKDLRRHVNRVRVRVSPNPATARVVVPGCCCCTAPHSSPGLWERDGRYRGGRVKVGPLTPICPLRRPEPESERMPAPEGRYMCSCLLQVHTAPPPPTLHEKKAKNARLWHEKQ